MRLTDLHPKFISHTGRQGMGMRFRCPCGCGVDWPIWFENPIDGGEPDREVENRWQRTGDTFETLTLSPSVFPKCWHGWIQNGDVINA